MRWRVHDALRCVRVRVQVHLGNNTLTNKCVGALEALLHRRPHVKLLLKVPTIPRPLFPSPRTPHQGTAQHSTCAYSPPSRCRSDAACCKCVCTPRAALRCPLCWLYQAGRPRLGMIVFISDKSSCRGMLPHSHAHDGRTLVCIPTCKHARMDTCRATRS